MLHQVFTDQLAYWIKYYLDSAALFWDTFRLSHEVQLEMNHSLSICLTQKKTTHPNTREKATHIVLLPYVERLDKEAGILSRGDQTIRTSFQRKI